MDFERLDFSPSFDAELNPFAPGDGDWRVPTFKFDEHGGVLPGLDARGSALMIRFALPDREWVGRFPGLGDARVLATPAPFGCVVATMSGDAWLLDVSKPEVGAAVLLNVTRFICSRAEPALLVLASWYELLAVDATGVAWRNDGPAGDDLDDVRFEGGELVCLAPGGRRLTIDSTTGAVLSDTPVTKP